MSLLQEADQKIIALAQKLEVLPEEIWKKIHNAIDDLAGLAEDNIDEVRAQIGVDVKAAEHNVGDVVENAAAAATSEAQETQKQVDGVVGSFEGEPVQQSQSSPQEPPQVAPATSSTTQGDASTSA